MPFSCMFLFFFHNKAKVEKSKKKGCQKEIALVRQQSRRTQDDTKQQKKQQEATDRSKTQGSHGRLKSFEKNN